MVSFIYVMLKWMDAQYSSMNEFKCSEHSVRILTLKKRITGKQSLITMPYIIALLINLGKR